MPDQHETMRKNREIHQKYQKIEKSLADYQNATDLFTGLLSQMGEEFGIPYIWVTIIDRPEYPDLIKMLSESETLKDRLRIIKESAIYDLIGDIQQSLLVNENLKPYYRLLPKNVKYFIKSIAVAPLGIHDHLLGSLNCGDPSSSRYQPGMDTGLLDQLAIQFSSRLSQIIPNEKNEDPKKEDVKEKHKK